MMTSLPSSTNSVAVSCSRGAGAAGAAQRQGQHIISGGRTRVARGAGGRGGVHCGRTFMAPISPRLRNTSQKARLAESQKESPVSAIWMYAWLLMNFMHFSTQHRQHLQQHSISLTTLFLEPPALKE